MTAEPAPIRRDLTRPALLRLLDRLDAGSAVTAASHYRSPGTEADLPDEIRAFALPPAGVTGLAVFWCEQARLIVAPPFPIERNGDWDTLQTAPLRELLMRDRTLGVVLVRLGGYSAGIYRGGAFVTTKTGGRFVKNRHRKGGQSQRRFERIREKQVREHFDDVAEVIRTMLVPVANDLDGLVLGGDRHTLQSMLKRAPLPAALQAKLLPRWIDVPEPRRDILEASPVAIWTSRALIVRQPPAGERAVPA